MRYAGEAITLTMENGVGHSYKYFVQEFDLEILAFLCWGIFIAGLIYIIMNSDMIKKNLNKKIRK